MLKQRGSFAVIVAVIAIIAVLSMAGCDMLTGGSSSSSKDDEIPQDVMEVAGGIFEYIGAVLQFYYHGPDLGYTLVASGENGATGWTLTFVNFEPPEEDDPPTLNGEVVIVVTEEVPFTASMDGSVTASDVDFEMTQLEFQMGEDLPTGGSIRIIIADPEFDETYDFPDPDPAPCEMAKNMIDGLRENMLKPPLIFYGLSVVDAEAEEGVPAWDLIFDDYSRPGDDVVVNGTIRIAVTEEALIVEANTALSDGLQLQNHVFKHIALDLVAWWDEEIRDEPDGVAGDFIVDGKIYDFAELFAAVD